MVTQTSDDFATECREAFLSLAREHAALDPNEPAKRAHNAKIRARKHVAIDHTLDQYLSYQAVAALDLPTPADLHFDDRGTE